MFGLVAVYRLRLLGSFKAVEVLLEQEHGDQLFGAFGASIT